MIESLESRQFMSVTPITPETAAVESAGKVSTNDFHFVMKANSSSPKVTIQDINFVIKVNKPSPTLML